MNAPIIILSISAALLAAGCANTGADYRPITDGPREPAYTADLTACQRLATQRGYLNDDTRSDALIGAGIGALAGLADDEVSNAEGAVAGLIVGAVAGGGAGMLKTRDQRREIVVECMRGRGHRVVG